MQISVSRQAGRARRRRALRIPTGLLRTGALIVSVGTFAIAFGLPLGDANAASPSGKAVRYLERAQNRDGGFGARKGGRSSQLHTAWTALGLAAAGRNPRDVARRRGRAAISYLRRAGSINETGELQRTILVLRAAGLSPRRFVGRNLVSALLRRERQDGSWGGLVPPTAFGVLAARAAGQPNSSMSVRGALSYLERAQNADGGFGLAPGGTSEADITAAALQAFACAGRRASDRARRAARYLERVQNSDGGFALRAGGASNVPSTSWAIQGLVAARVRLSSLRANPIRYLVRLQRRDGHIAYSRSSDQSPTWTTAQALAALRRKPFPLRPVPRATGRRRPRNASKARTSTTATMKPAEVSRTDRVADKSDRAPRRREDARTLTGDSPPRRSSMPARNTRADDGSDPVGALALAGSVVVALGVLGLKLRARLTRAPN